MAGETVLILGGGIGGITTANALRDQLGLEHLVVVLGIALLLALTASSDASFFLSF